MLSANAAGFWPEGATRHTVAPLRSLITAELLRSARLKFAAAAGGASVAKTATVDSKARIGTMINLLTNKRLLVILYHPYNGDIHGRGPKKWPAPVKVPAKKVPLMARGERPSKMRYLAGLPESGPIETVAFEPDKTSIRSSA
ncbi:hypothetical protein [Sandarakinorhabdus sp.]|uniref:hypothetical protein n=1 Tax=Sandarakinorhabdus sp. TaxID=1916663 RepID=UPI00286DF809|nr:hypothetical protein [Sandarakinorhabdus sp.]